ncbi:MAG: hypothetical protein V1709_11765 [Planctomycetota bacterium]
MDEKILKPSSITVFLLISFLVALLGFGLVMIYSGLSFKTYEERMKVFATISIMCGVFIQTYAYLKIFNTYIINNKGIMAKGALIKTFLPWNEISKAIFYSGDALHLEVNDKVMIEIMIRPILDYDELNKEITKYLPPEKIIYGGSSMIGGISRIWRRIRGK